MSRAAGALALRPVATARQRSTTHSLAYPTTVVVDSMTRVAMRITKAELQLMEAMWKLGPSSAREIQESLPEEGRLAYTTVQTMLYRLEQKGAVKRVKKIGNALIFEAIYTREGVYRRFVREILDVFGGSAKPIVSHLVEAGELTLADLREVELQLKRRAKP